MIETTNVVAPSTATTETTAPVAVPVSSETAPTAPATK